MEVSICDHDKVRPITAEIAHTFLKTFQVVNIVKGQFRNYKPFVIYLQLFVHKMKGTLVVVVLYWSSPWDIGLNVALVC